ncbi:MAG: carbohydrate kinase, partial [Microbacterium sp.]|nr:carbohydrate kinase [Microbacterium sp.]
MKICVIGIDVGLTSAKAAAFDDAGREIRTVSAPNPRVAVSRERQEIAMDTLWDVVADVLRDLTSWLAADGWTVSAVGATGHGNGLYLVDEQLRPVRPAIASTDSRAEHVVAALDPAAVERMRLLTGSLPWAAQPGVLLRWLLDNEPESLDRARWALTCKDWITACLTGVASADTSDSSGCGLVNLREREYEPEVFDMLGLP